MAAYPPNPNQVLGRRLHIAEFVRIPWPLGGLRAMAEAGEGTMLMIRLLDARACVRFFAAALPLALAATLTASAVLAQTPAPAPAKPAAAAPKPAPAPTAAAAPAAPKPAAAATPAAAPAGDAQPTLLGQYGDWGAYAATPNGRKVCFSIAKPKTSQTTPAGRKRDQAYVFVSTRPAENVRNEVSVIIGYPFKESTDATAEIGTDKFAMYVLNDGAWIKNVAEEARMVDSMRKGSDLTVKGVSGRGTESTDSYSLKGLSQALDRVTQECK
jgi:Invasion associated locus B (IalB) protein